MRNVAANAERYTGKLLAVWRSTRTLAGRTGCSRSAGHATGTPSTNHIEGGKHFSPTPAGSSSQSRRVNIARSSNAIGAITKLATWSRVASGAMLWEPMIAALLQRHGSGSGDARCLNWESLGRQFASKRPDLSRLEVRDLPQLLLGVG